MEVFVFGSNLAGRHGKGAALFAAQNYGAERGVGIGPTGNAYAIPTKDHDLKSLPIGRIEKYIADFADYARQNPETRFLLTPIGTGLAGHSKKAIWLAVRAANISENVSLTSSWLD